MADTDQAIYSIINELKKCSGYDIALMTTYNFEIEYFERAILSVLNAGNVKKVSLFVDAEEFTKALHDISSCHLGRKYMVSPVRINNSFHPKVILLLGEKKAKLIVSSANIKTSGYNINNEIFNYVEYSSEQPQYLDVIVEAIRFFRQINEYSYQLDNELLKEAEEFSYNHRAPKNGQVSLLFNLDESILGQVQKVISDPVEKIDIAVPYYDNNLAALKMLTEAFPEARIRLYIQNEKSTFPVSVYHNDSMGIEANGFEKIEGFSNNFYHGKVILFQTQRQSFALYGSANCTQAALTKSFQEGGNIECDFLETGNRGEFDDFFSLFHVIEGKPLVSNIMVFQSATPSNYYYKYGEWTEQLILHLGYISKKTEIKVSLGAEELSSRYLGNELIIEVPEEIRDNLPVIFDICLEYDGKKESMRCWTYSPAVLRDNRIKETEKDPLRDFALDSEGGKFREDRINLLKAELTCLPELEEHKKKEAYYKQIKLEQEGDDSEKEDYIIDIQIPDEYREEYRRYSEVAKIRGLFFKRFIQRNVGFLDKQEGDSGDECVEKPTDKHRRIAVSRKATSEEKSFERFVKNKVRGMLNDAYVSIIETEHYLGLIDVVLGIFQKYHVEERIDGIFSSEYVVNTSAMFFIKLLEKSTTALSEELSKAILFQSFEILYMNYIERDEEKDQEKRQKYDNINRDLLMALEHRYGIREDYKKYIYLIAYRDGITDPVLLNAYTLYTENLFGFMNYNMLTKYIRGFYKDAEITVVNQIMRIQTTSTKIISELKPNANIISEIRRFSRNVTAIRGIQIQIISQEEDSLRKNVIAEIRHTIDLVYGKWSSVIIRRNGNKEYSKPQYISY